MTTVAAAELDSLVRREHHNPHSILGAHAGDGGVVIRALRPAACEVKAHVEGGDVVELAQIHPGGVFEGTVEGAELPLRYELEVDYGSAGTFTIDDPYAFGPTIGELRPPPDRRGPPRGDLREARSARPDDGCRPAGHRHGVRGLGAGRAGGQRRRRLQLMGRTAARDALARRERDLGAVPARRRGRGPLQVRDPQRRRRAQAESRSVRARSRASAEDGVDRVQRHASVERGRRSCGAASAPASSRCRARCRSTRSTSARGG